MATGVTQQTRVVRMDDVHGQIRVRLAQLIEQFALEAEVHAVPEAEAVGLALLDVVGRELARGLAGELGADVGGERVVEGAEAVDCAGDAVEGDAF